MSADTRPLTVDGPDLGRNCAAKWVAGVLIEHPVLLPWLTHAPRRVGSGALSRPPAAFQCRRMLLQLY